MIEMKMRTILSSRSMICALGHLRGAAPIKCASKSANPRKHRLSIMAAHNKDLAEVLFWSQNSANNRQESLKKLVDMKRRNEEILRRLVMHNMNFQMVFLKTFRLARVSSAVRLKMMETRINFFWPELIFQTF